MKTATFLWRKPPRKKISNFWGEQFSKQRFFVKTKLLIHKMLIRIALVIVSEHVSIPFPFYYQNNSYFDLYS